LWEGHHWQVITPVGLIALSVPVRLLADLVPQFYGEGLAAAGILWLAGVVLWGVIYIPKLGPAHITPD
jgi:uncharacterized protein involved in response to NO